MPAKAQIPITSNSDITPWRRQMCVQNHHDNSANYTEQHGNEFERQHGGIKSGIDNQYDQKYAALGAADELGSCA